MASSFDDIHVASTSNATPQTQNNNTLSPNQAANTPLDDVSLTSFDSDDLLNLSSPLQTDLFSEFDLMHFHASFQNFYSFTTYQSTAALFQDLTNHTFINLLFYRFGIPHTPFPAKPHAPMADYIQPLYMRIASTTEPLSYPEDFDTNLLALAKRVLLINTDVDLTLTDLALLAPSLPGFSPGFETSKTRLAIFLMAQPYITAALYFSTLFPSSLPNIPYLPNLFKSFFATRTLDLAGYYYSAGVHAADTTFSALSLTPPLPFPTGPWQNLAAQHASHQPPTTPYVHFSSLHARYQRTLSCLTMIIILLLILIFAATFTLVPSYLMSSKTCASVADQVTKALIDSPPLFTATVTTTLPAVLHETYIPATTTLTLINTYTQSAYLTLNVTSPAVTITVTDVTTVSTYAPSPTLDPIVLPPGPDFFGHHLPYLGLTPTQYLIGSSIIAVIFISLVACIAWQRKNSGDTTTTQS